MKNQLLLGIGALFLLINLAACNSGSIDPGSSASARVNAASSSTATSGTATCGRSETVITQAQLPAAAGTYLTATYPGYTFVQAAQGTTSSGSAYYEVRITYNGTTKKLRFDAAGAVVSSGSGSNSEVVITQDKLPAAIGTYLTTTYPGYTFVQAEQETTSTGTTYYEVKFTYNSKTKELRFDASGTVLK